MPRSLELTDEYVAQLMKKDAEANAITNSPFGLGLHAGRR